MMHAILDKLAAVILMAMGVAIVAITIAVTGMAIVAISAMSLATLAPIVAGLAVCWAIVWRVYRARGRG